MVASFIAQGMVVPAKVLSSAQSGHCRVEALGQEIVVRCRPGEKPRGDAAICVRGSDLTAAQPGEPGMDGTVRRAVYKGGGARIEFVPAAAPDAALHFEQRDPNPFEPGATARLRIASGWLIPAEGPA
jgi:iron(III) transport system ATP-binding protein